MRPLLLEIYVTLPVAALLMGVTLLWSALLLRRGSAMTWGEAFRRAGESLLTFGSKGNTPKADISVPGSLGTIVLALAIYGLVKDPVRLPVFGYALMAFCGFSFTALAGTRTGPRVGVEPVTAVRVAFLCAFFGILGARVFYVVEFWDRDFATQPAACNFGTLTPRPGDELVVKTALGSTRVVFKGDEKTPAEIVKRLEPIASVGARATVLMVTRRDYNWDEIKPIERGFVVETLARGEDATLGLSGSFMPVGPVDARGVTPPLTAVFAIWNGGLVYYGGMVFGTLAILVYVRLQKQRVAQIADLASSCAALGVAFGRVGCFLNGCCWGRRSDLPWSIRFPLYSPAWIQHATSVLGAQWDLDVDHRIIPAPTELAPRVVEALTEKNAQGLCQGSWPLHPVQVYAILLDLSVFAVMYLFVRYRVKREWQTFFLWFVLYAIIRFIIEHFRADSESFVYLLGYPLTPSQRVAVLTFPFSVAGLIWASKRGRPIVPWSPPKAP
jgi:prolipoprotein diacylglyceryl transferase